MTRKLLVECPARPFLPAVLLFILIASSCAGDEPVVLPAPALNSIPPMTCPTVRANKEFDFNNAGPAIGDTAIDFTLKSTSGQNNTLSKLLAEKPVLLVFGSFTWPMYRDGVAGTETLYKRYSQDIKIVVIYTLEAHPCGIASPYTNKEWTMGASWDAAGNPLGQPQSYAERLATAKQCVRELGVSPLVLVDGMNNGVWCAYGGAPNNAYLIGKDGKILAKHGWYQPDGMELSITGLLKRQTRSPVLSSK